MALRGTRTRSRKAAVAVCAAVTAVTAWIPVGAQAAPDEAATARQVVLPTGERVLLDDYGRVAGVISDEGRGRGHAAGDGLTVDGYDSVTRDGATRVVPHAARAGLADGTLDPGLFNVTEPGRDLPSPVERDAAAETANVTLAPTDRAGEAAADWEATVVDLATFDSTWVYPTDPDDGTLELDLPFGEYAVYTWISLWEGDTITGADLLLMPHVSVTGDTTLDFPAAVAKEMDLDFPEEDAGAVQTSIGLDVRAAGAEDGYASVLTLDGVAPEGIRTAQLGEPADGFEVSGSIYKGMLDGDREYATAHSRPDGFYTGLTQHSDWRDLARITTEAGMTRENAWGFLATTPSVPYFIAIGSQRLPISREVYVRADSARWSQYFAHSGGGTHVSYSGGDERAYCPGEEYRTTFNTGVFGPVLSAPDDGLFRQGNTLHGEVNLLADGSGHRSYDASGDGHDDLYDGASTTLYRNGEEYATAEGPLEETRFEVPAEEAEYRLVATVARDAAVSSVSTEVTAEYTFTSGAGRDGSVPAYAVRFSPELALDNTAPADRPFEVPVTVQGSAAGADPASLDVSVAVSLDGGETWADAPVREGRISVDNPPAGGSVSFRAEVADQDGNTLSQTIVDAYRTR